MKNPLELFLPIKPFRVLPGKAFGPTHNGIDLEASYGQPVRAAHDGTAYIDYGENNGWGVVVRTDDKRDLLGGSFFVHSIYWHLQQGNFPIKSGDKVRVGDIIGYAGNTGNVTPKPTPENPTAGTHLHFGILIERVGDQPWAFANPTDPTGLLGCVDPGPFLSLTAAEDAGKGYQLVATVRAFLASFKAQSTSVPQAKAMKFALAIGRQEGYFAPGENPNYPNGSRSWRNCNIGNLKLTDYTKSLGAIGADDQGHAIFASQEDGKKALCQFVTDAANNKLLRYHDVDVLKFCQIYQEKDPINYAIGLSKDLGVGIHTPLRELI